MRKTIEIPVCDWMSTADGYVFTNDRFELRIVAVMDGVAYRARDLQTGYAMVLSDDEVSITAQRMIRQLRIDMTEKLYKKLGVTFRK